ncbi:MAG: phytanoyl-CoA dioxygenase family protein [Oligoflexia bacterium]|nr:phytanoyl-CoA dioxygenase family protein [Oligoflexia bacterium]
MELEVTSKSSQSFETPAKLSPRDYYSEHGYVVVPQVIPSQLVDRLLNQYKKEILNSKYPFFRQSTGRYEPNAFTEHGFVKQSFLDIHDMAPFPEFAEAARQVFFSPELIGALRGVTTEAEFNLMQTMMFDANTATVPHQDWWYLDSIPLGQMTAAWIALEDIDEKAGRFFVIPKTLDVDLLGQELDLPHSEWLKRMKKYFDQNRDRVVAPALKKGDVIFWNSRTIHGALETIDPSFSRKSLTAHFIPSQLKFGNLFITKDFIKYQTYKGMKYYRNQPDYSFFNRIKYDFKLWVYNSPRILRGLRKIQKYFH